MTLFLLGVAVLGVAVLTAYVMAEDHARSLRDE